ncbi:MAG: hypothetical protein R6W69_06060 [Anaerolineales bacterium]
MKRHFAFLLLVGLLLNLLAGCAPASQPASPSIATEPASADAALPLPTFTPAPSPMPGGLYVDAGQSLGQVSPVFAGTNWGPWLGIAPAMLDEIPKLGLNVVRFPGGEWGDTNTVTKSQVDMLVAFCQQWGAEPMIHVRLPNSTPGEAAELVRYANIEKGYNIRYWVIGNEPNLYAGRAEMKKPEYTPEQFATDWRFFADAMKAADPSILLVGPEISQFVPNPTPEYGQVFKDWLVTFLKANGDMVDIVSVHRYPFPASFVSGPPSKDDLRANSAEWDILIPSLHEIVREHTGRDLPVAVTEFNSSWSANAGGEATMDSHFNGVWFADVMGRMINNDTFMLTQFAISGNFGLMSRAELNSTGLAYVMFSRFGNERIYASSDQQYVSVYAAKRPDGALTVMVINLNSEPKTVNLRIDNFNGGQAEVWRLDLNNRAEQVQSVQLAAINTLNLSRESVTLYILPGLD